MSISDKLTTIAENEQKVYEAGEKSEYDKFWDTFQNYGEPMKYHYTFSGAHWNDTTFKPKYNIVFNSQDSNYMFWDSRVTEINVDIDTRNSSGWHQIAYSATRLKKIQKVILKEDGSQSSNAPFSSASRLEYIRFEGKIGVTVSFSSCPLDLESAKNVIEHLMDYSGTDKDLNCKITFSGTTKALLEAEGATAPEGYTWLEYATVKGWNT